MSILDTSSKDTTITYEFSLDQMRKLIAHDLNVAEREVTVEYVLGDDGYDGPGWSSHSSHRVCTKVKVTVKKTGDDSERWDR